MTDRPVIKCNGLWKIFGKRESEALIAARDQGMSKKDVLEKLECVVGVADVSFEVSRGEIFCIMGLSGSGKSTLVRHLNRLIDPSAGEVLINGQDINKLNSTDLRALRAENVGMVFQNMALLPHRTVSDNVALSLELRGVSLADRKKVASEKLALVSLAGWEERYPDELSGGMKQRVGLARAMAADPDILLMDEPFSALDPLIRRQLQSQFLELSRIVKKTTIFITHDLDEAIRLGNRIAIMKDGRFVQVGTPEDIVTAPADEYVADFVSGISRLDLVTAGKIMKPVKSLGKINGKGIDSYPTANSRDKIGTLLKIVAASEAPIIVRDGGEAVGVITKKTLLEGIQGFPEDK